MGGQITFHLNGTRETGGVLKNSPVEIPPLDSSSSGAVEVETSAKRNGIEEGCFDHSDNGACRLTSAAMQAGGPD